MTSVAPHSPSVFKGMDICKLLAAFLIVLLHATETTNLMAREVQFICTRFAVPFFFMASGFFFARGIHARPAEQQGSYMKKYFSHLLLTYVVWALIIYLPFTLHSYFTLPKYADSSVIYITSVLLRKLFIVGPGPYWYLMALMGSVLVLYTLRKSTISIAILTVACFALLLLYTCARDVAAFILPLELLFRGIDFLYSWQFNFLTFGIPFCGIGYLAYHYQWKVSLRYAVPLFLLFTVLRAAEFSSVTPEGSLSFLYIPQAVCFFFLALGLKLNISDATSRTLRQLSSFIYFAHAILLYNILNPMLSAAGFRYTFAPEAILPKTMFIILVCCALFLLLRKRQNGFCKILING